MVSVCVSNGFTCSVEHVAAVFQHQAIQIRLGRIVRRLRPAQVLGEALTQHRKADPHRAVRRDAGRGELHFEVGVDVAPLQVRVAHQHRLTRRRPGRGDGPLVGAVRLDVGARQSRRQLCRIDDPVVVNDPQAVRVDVFDADRQHPLRLGTEVGLVLGRPGVQPAHERLDQRTKLHALSRRPLLRAFQGCRWFAPIDRRSSSWRRRTPRRARAPARRAEAAVRCALPSARSRTRRTGSAWSGAKMCGTPYRSQRISVPFAGAWARTGGLPTRTRQRTTTGARRRTLSIGVLLQVSDNVCEFSRNLSSV